MRPFLNEALTSLDGPLASPERLVRMSWMILLVVFPFVLVPTGLNHYISVSGAWQPEVARWLAFAWGVQVLAIGMASAAIIWLQGKGASRLLTYVAVAGMMISNEISTLAVGSLTS